MTFLQLSEWASHGVRLSDPTTKNPIKSFLASSNERVAFDLHVGDALERDHTRIRMPDDAYVLRPHECIRIVVREHLTMPNNVFGTICSRASLTAQGLFVSNLKVDPLFIGHLSIAVFNAGKRPIKISRGTPFACLFIGELASAVLGEPRSPTSDDGLVFSSWRIRVRVYLPYILTVVASVAAGVISRLL